MVIMTEAQGMLIENKNQPNQGGLVWGWKNFHLLCMFGLGANRNISLSTVVALAYTLALGGQEKQRQAVSMSLRPA